MNPCSTRSFIFQLTIKNQKNKNMLFDFELDIKNEKGRFFHYFNFRLGSKIRNGKTGCRTEFRFNI